MCHAHLVQQRSKDAGRTVIFNKCFRQNTIAFYYEPVIITLVKINIVHQKKHNGFSKYRYSEEIETYWAILQNFNTFLPLLHP